MRCSSVGISISQLICSVCSVNVLGWRAFYFMLFAFPMDSIEGRRHAVELSLQCDLPSLMVHLCVSLSVEPIPTGRLSSQCVTEAHEIRAESTQNNHTELRDNAEPKHQRETGGRCFIYHPTRIHPEEKHGDEMRCYCPTSLAQEKQDVMSFYAWGDWWTACATGMETFLILFKQTVAPLIHAHIFFCLWLHLEAGKCVDYLAWASSASSMMGIDIMKLWIDLRLQGFFFFWLFDCSWRKSSANLNRAPLCTIHCAGDWCGFSHCQCLFYSRHKGFSSKGGFSGRTYAA